MAARTVCGAALTPCGRFPNFGTSLDANPGPSGKRGGSRLLVAVPSVHPHRCSLRRSRFTRGGAQRQVSRLLLRIPVPGKAYLFESPSRMSQPQEAGVLHVPKAVPGLDFILESFTRQPPTWASSIAVTTTVFTLGYPGLAAGLSLPGVAAAYLLGLFVWRGFGFQGFLTVCLYFIIGTAVTKVRLKQKEAEGIAEKRKGRRGPASVVGSGFAGALCSLAAVAYGVDATSVGSAAWLYRLLELGFVASFCTKLSDTTSSEIGKAYGKSTFLVTTLERVPRGTEGAISLEGTVAGLIAAIVLASLALASGEVSWAGALLCVLASQVANYGESYLGATLQDKPGLEWLNNDFVNVLNILTGAGLAMALGLFVPL